MTAFRSARRPCAGASARRGFTLVEILLSLALMMLVLAAAYAAIDLFRRVTVAGRADAERSQLARAIERKFAADLRAVVFRPPQPVEEEAAESSVDVATMSAGVGAADDAGDTTTTVTSSSTETTDTSSQAATTAPVLGLFGDAATLTIHVSRPPRGGAFVIAAPAADDPAAAAPAAGDLREVVYSIGGLPGVGPAALAAARPMSAAPAAASGLTRQEGAPTPPQVDAAAGAFSSAAVAQTAAPVVVAGEVTELAFRYFDGVAWLDVWDSSAVGALPRAVEVTLRVKVVPVDRPVMRTPLATEDPTVGTEVYRFVIALPLADPVPPAEEV